MPEINAKNFTRADFLSPTQVAQKLNMDPKVVRKTMLEQFRKGTKILTDKSRGPQPIIYNMKSMHRSPESDRSSPLRLHPLALEKFKEILTKGS